MELLLTLLNRIRKDDETISCRDQVALV
jgi:7-cyano-7-deazaguanine synthase in queuosine biosynthesis